MSSSTFPLQLNPTLPIAINTLDLEPEKRSYHRLRSFRKLQGTTPPFLDLGSELGIMPTPSTLASPRTRAIRRKGQLFHSKPFTASSSPSYPDINLVAKHDNHRSGKSGEVKLVRAGSKGPQILAQPFLLQLRSVSVPYVSTTIKSAIPPPLDQSQPLSSISSSFNMDTSTTSSRPRHALTSHEKRKKLDKLTRTLGENIPPELVFPPSPSPLQRRTSMTAFQTQRSKLHKKSPSLVSPPSLPTTTTTSPQPRMAEGKDNVNPPHAGRPRSMIVSTSKTTPSARGTSSLEISIDPPFHDVDAPFHDVDDEIVEQQRQQALSVEWGRRKEREWSGEWNVKDMNHVVRALRGLKAT